MIITCMPQSLMIPDAYASEQLEVPEVFSELEVSNDQVGDSEVSTDGAVAEEQLEVPETSTDGAVVEEQLEVPEIPSLLYASNTDIWTGGIDTAWYTNNTGATSYDISTGNQLAGLAKLVNDGTNSFKVKPLI